MTRIVLKLGNLPLEVKIAFVKKVLQMMTGNPNFTTPVPPLADVQTQLTKTENAKTNADAARTISKEKTAILHQEEKVMDSIITKLANYVEVEANDDVAVIESAGFTPASKPTPIGELHAPQGLAVTTGDDAGELDIHWDVVLGAKSYIIQLNSVDPLKEEDWKENTLPTKSSSTLKNLVSGTRYWIRVAAVGSAGKSGWSDVATKIAP